MGTCSPCFSPTLRSVLAGIVQLLLSTALIALHSLCLMKIITEKQVYGPYFRSITTATRQAPPPAKPQSSFTGYHIFTLFLAIVMFVITPILFCGMIRDKPDYICTWMCTNWIMVFLYALILLFSLRVWILGFVIENVLVLAVLVNVVCCVNPMYDIMKIAKRNQDLY
ncbi:uncharacterized protein [Halyomorpha halys]|uniref:uncharacterized protein n=1 Tax=Halyomorpha halys TaxID=286706 RepID=UPI0006D507F2|nr:uncharacterized protein LOC106691820 [Halyomorpha halys]